jgi:hypothetical protein
MEAFEQDLLSALRDREPGESMVQAFGRFALRPRGFLGSPDPQATEGMRMVARVMTSSPALLAREREILDGYTSTVAALIAEEKGMAADDIEPWVIANALIGVHRALIASAHRQALAGVEVARIARSLRRHGARALEILEQGLD